MLDHVPAGTVGKISKRYFSWEQIHATCQSSVDLIQKNFAPTLLVPIAGGGLVPARMMRSTFKQRVGKTLPMQVVGAVHYDDDAGCVRHTVQRTQWLSPDLDLNGARLLLVDEVDDSRKTLAFIVNEFLRYFVEVKAAHEAKAGAVPWVAPQLGVYVIHNKVRAKEAEIDPSVFPQYYFIGENTPNMWHIYPWDAEDILACTAIAHAQAHYFSQRPDELANAYRVAATVHPKAAASATQHYADGGSQDNGNAVGALLALQALNAEVLNEAQPVGGEAPLPAGGPKARSALTSMLSGGAGAAAQSVIHVAGEDTVSEAGQEADEDAASSWKLNGMYQNMGYVPSGFAPRFGSLTLVDDGHLSHNPTHKPRA
mmetsp:Transcript_2550/g.4320  ORF Transcript_2550/g.4320 Transcript_2550/m.4320 type:complete len:370 (-) Transcript_2550:1058-2167(-)